MLRDTRKSADYFDNLLPQFREGISDITSALSDGSITLPDEQTKYAHELFELQLTYCIASYSSGETLEELKPKVEQILSIRKLYMDRANTLPERQQVYRNQFEEIVGNENRNLTHYINSLWWLSLVVATQQPKEHCLDVINCIGNKGKDALLDRIALAMGEENRKQADTLAYPHLYKTLFEAFSSSKTKSISLVQQFLSEWYTSCWQALWFDNHSKEDEEEGNWDFYFGYWSLEAALITNLLKIDDSEYSNDKYYPADLINPRQLRIVTSD